jgi:hypothetical protein
METAAQIDFQGFQPSESVRQTIAAHMPRWRNDTGG